MAKFKLSSKSTGKSAATSQHVQGVEPRKKKKKVKATKSGGATQERSVKKKKKKKRVSEDTEKYLPPSKLARKGDVDYAPTSGDLVDTGKFIGGHMPQDLLKLIKTYKKEHRVTTAQFLRIATAEFFGKPLDM